MLFNFYLLLCILKSLISHLVMLLGFLIVYEFYHILIRRYGKSLYMNGNLALLAATSRHVAFNVGALQLWVMVGWTRCEYLDD